MRRSINASTLPPPPPPPTAKPPTKKSKKIKIASIVVPLIVVIIVASLFILDIIPWRPKPGGPSPPATMTYGIATGKVTDTYNYPIANVNVTIGSQNGTTNEDGWFSISNVTAGNQVHAKFSKSGYATTYRVVQIQTGKSSFMEITMSEVDITAYLDASSGGTITTWDGGSITVEPNSLIDSQNNPFSGTAYVDLTTFDPSDEIEANAFPGEYLGISAQGETSPIKSFGFMDISITDGDGETLQLEQGENATVNIPVPYSMQSEAESMGTCPLWYFNTTLGNWLEVGYGAYDSVLGCFVGNITHFSTWNFDVCYPAAYISGRVVDSSGDPVQGATVRCWAEGWYQQRWASGETFTPANGTFKRIPVEVGVVFKYHASKGGHQSSVRQAGPLSQDQEYNVGDIVLDAPIVEIMLTWGDDPRDLDSHLTARPVGNVTFHIYYGGMGSIDSDPYAMLDTDDTTSYGPEVTSISRLRQGTYRYSVRHFAGDGTIETSGAEVNVIIPDVGIYRFTPPAGQPQGTNIWRVFDIAVDANGAVTAFTPINDYVTGADHSTLLFP